MPVRAEQGRGNKRTKMKDYIIPDLIGAGLVLFAILTGTEIIIFPLIVIALIVIYASGRG
jgi:hypothetical protein